MFKLIDKIVGLRVSTEEELEGLDLAEHGGVAYPDFGLSTHGGVMPVGNPTTERSPMDASIPVRQEGFKSFIMPVTKLSVIFPQL